MILPDDEEMGVVVTEAWQGRLDTYCDGIAKATGKKILIQLQAIYNIPDLGAENKRMGEFIQELLEEVG